MFNSFRMKIAFFSEGNYTGKVSRSVAGRTDQAWMAALDATHHPLFSTPASRYDVGIVIPPKNYDGQFTDISEHHRRHCDRLCMMQEGDARLYWQDRSIDQQVNYIYFLAEVDIIFCHNEIDRKYFIGLVPDKDVRILPTVMIEDAIPMQRIRGPVDRSGVMVNGNWCSWYGAADSFFIAQEFKQSIAAPIMGRMDEGEMRISEIEHLPYTNWADWMANFSARKYAVNLMRTIAAASFSLNAAWLSIPCVGWDVQDTQRICFPELSVPMGDMQSARKIAKHLATNDLFYEHCSAYAKKMAIDIYSEERFRSNFYESFQGQ